MEKKVLLITPPMVQLNAPYPATPVLSARLKAHGVVVAQADLSIALALQVFSRSGVRHAVDAARAHPDPPSHVRAFLDDAERIGDRIDDVIRFLQGRAPELAWRIIRRDFLPEGPHFRELDPSEENLDEENLLNGFGALGVQDCAKHLASLFLDDLADVFRDTLDPAFTLARYAEHLAVSAPSLDPILDRLRETPPSWVDALLDARVCQLLADHQPDFIGVTAPFPGTVYGAFRIAQTVRRQAPGTFRVLGGGYVNSELRDMDDPRVFDFFDAVCFDDGEQPWLGLLGLGPRQRIATRTSREPDAANTPRTPYRVPVSDYDGLDLNAYLSLLETANPMHRLWSDGRWIKTQLAAGCYWHRCAFCDVSLDYIRGFVPAQPGQAVDALLQMKANTGLCAFHFTDEALPPALIEAVSDEICRRGATLAWWGNIRLDTAFTTARIAKMAEAGCIAVSAGLECANDRLLTLMNKGITLKQARRVCERLAAHGIMTHVYLMYGFPTQTHEETLDALDIVRALYADGLIQSSYWHRFALTVHSPIARNPEAFGITIPPPSGDSPRFARNEIAFHDPVQGSLETLGRTLRIANDNFIRGAGLDIPARDWFAITEQG